MVTRFTKPAYMTCGLKTNEAPDCIYTLDLGFWGKQAHSTNQPLTSIKSFPMSSTNCLVLIHFESARFQTQITLPSAAESSHV